MLKKYGFVVVLLEVLMKCQLKYVKLRLNKLIPAPPIDNRIFPVLNCVIANKAAAIVKARLAIGRELAIKK